MFIKPTEEQEAILKAVKEYERVKVYAKAGCGKTTTLKLIAKDNPDKKILYLAFNKAIADEARGSFPENVEVRTIHSLAYVHVGKKYKNRLSSSFDIFEICDKFNVEFEFVVLFLRIFNSWLHTDITFKEDKRLTNFIKKIDVNGYVFNLDEVKEMKGFLKEFWNEIKKVCSNIKITHDVYLKLFELNFNRYKCKDKYNIVFLDEANDTNDVTLSIFNRFNEKKIMVGDKYQKIYGFRGSINGMEKFKADKVLHLTYTFRFDDEEKVRLVNDYLQYCQGERKEYLIKPFGRKDDDNRIETECYLCRTNAKVLEMLEVEDLKTVRHPDNFFKNIYLLLKRKYKIGFKEDVRFLSGNDYYEKVKEVAEVIGDMDVYSSANLILRVIRMGFNPYQYFDELKDKAISLYFSNLKRFVGTAHSCKGLEFDRVVVCDDFPTIEELIEDLYKSGRLHGVPETPVLKLSKSMLTNIFKQGSNKVKEELNLLYVVLTRFKKEIELPEIYYLKDEYAVELYKENKMKIK